MQIGKVGVVGAGTMGASIAVALVGRGFPVVLKDIDDQAVRAGMGRIDRMLDSRVKKGLPQEEADAMRALIQPATDYSAFPDIDLVIEAVAENIEIKRKVFEDLDDCCNIHAILATNTSSLPITRVASFTRRPDKVVGMHFFNPAHLMKLVEIIPGLDTSPVTVRTALEFGQKLGKLAVRVEECASFLVNRLLGRYMNEALWCLQEGLATIEEIDAAACEFAAPIGPLALRDMNGADIGLAVAKFNFQEYGERFRPPDLLEEMVRANLLGQKTGGGFYVYDPESKKRSGPNPALASILDKLGRAAGSNHSFKVERMFLPMINEAFLVLQEKVCEAEDLDPALMAGLGLRKGPLSMAAEMGLDDCLAQIETLFEQKGERFRPAPLLKRYVWAKRASVI
jgi:3-hydroxyacyl-CoA dehydrogenase